MDHLSASRRSALKYAALIVLATRSARAFPRLNTKPSVSGYGGDPNLLARPVPWQKTLSQSQLNAVAGLCEIIVPAEPPFPSASALGVHEFVDEWLSAPYPEMRADRDLILSGLVTLDRVSMERNEDIFACSSESSRINVFEEFCKARGVKQNFARRIIELVGDGYYTTRQGHAAIGYVGNVPLTEFPGTSPEIAAHLNSALAALGNSPIDS